MTQTKFCEQDCQEVKAQLDSYLDKELPPERSAEIAEHFEHCGSCKRSADERRGMRVRLQTVVRDARVPDDLEARIRERLRQERQPRSKGPFLMAIAATIAVCFGLYHLHGEMSPALTAGLNDHIHCAIEHHGADTKVGVNRLPAAEQPLVQVAQPFVPADMHLLLAHECGDAGRRFIHLTYGDGHHRLSVMMTRRRNGETLGHGVIAAASGRYRVAGFEARDYWIYTVSDLSESRNTHVLTAMGPALQQFLDRMKA